MSKEQRFETQFDGNKWLVADKENDTLLGGFSSAKMLNEFVDKVADLETKLADLQQEQIKEMQEHQEAMKLADKTIKDTEEQNKRVLEKLELIVSANQELEQKLAESEETARAVIEAHIRVMEERDELKQQLAEKDEAHMKAMENALNDFLTLRQELNQGKISFCIEQLSTMRNFVNSKAIFSKNECEREVCRDISQTIANRIKRLEEGE